jgi:hypothetical protein
MNYFFHQAVFLAGKRFSVGLHDVSEKAENDPHFLKFISAGYISDASGAASGPPNLSPFERSQNLLDKLIKEKRVKMPATVQRQSMHQPVSAHVPQTEAQKAAAPVAEAPAEALAEETPVESAPSGKKSKR